MPWPSRIYGGPKKWSASRDTEGHRIYKLTVQIKTDSSLYGPATVMQTPGLPLPGSLWLIDYDVDVYAWCRWENDVVPVVVNEPNNLWEMTFTYSTKPPDPRKQRETKGPDPNHPDQPDQGAQSPLSEPSKINGSSQRYTEEATVDSDLKPLLTSSFEILHGPQVTFDKHRGQVTISQNTGILAEQGVSGLLDCVNDLTLWDHAPRCVKFSDWTWERLFYQNALKYYNRKLVFEIDDLTFDKTALDEGTKALRGDWDKNPSSITFDRYVVAVDPVTHFPYVNTNPKNFDKFKDRKGNLCKVVLNGHGEPIDATGPITEDSKIKIKKYPTANLFYLGLPASLE